MFSCYLNPTGRRHRLRNPGSQVSKYPWWLEYLRHSSVLYQPWPRPDLLGSGFLTSWGCLEWAQGTRQWASGSWQPCAALIWQAHAGRAYRSLQPCTRHIGRLPACPPAYLGTAAPKTACSELALAGQRGRVPGCRGACLLIILASRWKDQPAVGWLGTGPFPSSQSPKTFVRC